MTYDPARLGHLTAGERSCRVPSSSRAMAVEAHGGMEVRCQALTQRTVALESHTDLQETFVSKE